MKPDCPKCQRRNGNRYEPICKHIIESVKEWHRANYTQAIELLKDEKLVWSEDMNAIRQTLADALEEARDLSMYENESLNYLAVKLIAEENDLSWGD